MRKGYKQIYFRSGYKIYSQHEALSHHTFDLYTRTYFSTNGSLNERTYMLSYYLSFQNMAVFQTTVGHFGTHLPYSTYLISSDQPLPAERGTKLTVGTDINYRRQPWGNFGINYHVNRVKLAEGFGAQDIHLIGSKAEIAFSQVMFLTSFIQYNTQVENFNVNVRFQWRYRTMSDIYLVYTNNYHTNHFTQRDLGLILKVNYWLNV